MGVEQAHDCIIRAFDAMRGIEYITHLQRQEQPLMATLSRIERVLRHDGIVAVLDLTAEQASAGMEPSWVGDEKWRPIVLESVRLRQIANEPQVRVLVGEHAVLVSGDEKHVVGVVFIKGHPVVKSVVRMVRPLLRQPNTSSSRRSVTAAAPAPAVAPAPVAAPAVAPVGAPNAPSNGGSSGDPSSSF